MLPSKHCKTSKITRSNAKKRNVLVKLHTRLLLRRAPPHKFCRRRSPISRRHLCENLPTYHTTQICLRTNSKTARRNPDTPRLDLTNLARKFRISYSLDLRELSLSSIANSLRHSLSVLWPAFARAHAIQLHHNLQRQAFRALSLPIVSSYDFLPSLD